MDEKSTYKLHDKGDFFPFFIERMPPIYNGILNNTCYSAFAVETFRIGRPTLSFSNFLPKVRELVS